MEGDLAGRVVEGQPDARLPCRGPALEVELESGGLRAYRPKEVWTVEEDDGFIRAIEIVRDDDTREIVRVRRLGVRRAD